MCQSCEERRRRNLSVVLPLLLSRLPFPFRLFQPLATFRPHPFRAAASHPDLDTDFSPNTSLFDLNLAERCTTPACLQTLFGFDWDFSASLSLLTSCYVLPLPMLFVCQLCSCFWEEDDARATDDVSKFVVLSSYMIVEIWAPGIRKIKFFP